jgi:beta-phosphoglucomutase
MLQGVIFDLDGVIVDSHPAHKRAWKSFFASVGIDVADRELEVVLEGQKRKDILEHFLGELSDEEVARYGAAKDSLFRQHIGQVQTVRGFSEFAHQVEEAGIPIAVGSSASRNRTEYMLEQFRLSERFGAVITGDDVEKGKPDPAIFQLAAHELGVEPGNVLVCEDAANGVAAAKAAGMKCLAIAANGRGPILRRAGADKVVPDFSAISLEQARSLFLPKR